MAVVKSVLCESARIGGMVGNASSTSSASSYYSPHPTMCKGKVSVKSVPRMCKNGARGVIVISL